MPKRKCTFSDKYSKEWNFITKGKFDDDVECKICRRMFSIAHGGRSDILQHINSQRHKLNISSAAECSKIVDSYFLKPNTDIEAKVIEAEVTMTFHAIKHHQSFISTDCSSKLYSTVFSDSNIANTFSSARIKKTAIIKNVLAPPLHSRKWFGN